MKTIERSEQRTVTENKWNGKSRGGRFGYLFFVQAIRVLGIRCAYVFLAFIVLYFIPFAPRATAAIWQYNRKIRKYGPGKSIAKLVGHYYVFGQTLIDRIAIRGGAAHRYHFEFEHYDRFREIIDGPQGVVMIGAHVGCWQAGSAFFGKYGKKMNIVMFDSEHQQIKEVLEQHAEKQNFKIIPVNEDTLGAMILIKSALNDGEYVCFNGDRYIDRHSAIETDFMGHPALFPSGPLKIACKCHVPVVFYYALREKNRTYRFIFQEAVMERRTSVEQLLKQYTVSLEQLLQRYPQQWFNFYKFWND